MAFKQFDRVPNHYTGPVIQRIKDFRQDMGKRSLAPTVLTVGELEVLVPRHFGFCFGVERAIHMAFSALERHPERQINLLSEIIRNPLVNDDLEQRGMLDSTLVLMMGEFGRTPTINEQNGRHHWTPIMSMVMAGGGLPCGQVIGSSDAKVGESRSGKVRPQVLAATTFKHLGIDLDSHWVNNSGRPVPVVTEGGRPIPELC